MLLTILFDAQTKRSIRQTYSFGPVDDQEAFLAEREGCAVEDIGYVEDEDGEFYVRLSTRERIAFLVVGRAPMTPP